MNALAISALVAVLLTLCWHIRYLERENAELKAKPSGPQLARQRVAPLAPVKTEAASDPTAFKCGECGELLPAHARDCRLKDAHRQASGRTQWKGFTRIKREIESDDRLVGRS